MRKFLISLFMLLSLALSAANLPVDREIGRLSAAEEGSPEGLVREAFSKEFSLAWVEEYVAAGYAASFAAFYSSRLSELLPLQNMLIGEMAGSEIKLRDGESAVRISVFLDENLKFTSLGIR